MPPNDQYIPLYLRILQHNPSGTGGKLPAFCIWTVRDRMGQDNADAAPPPHFRLTARLGDREVANDVGHHFFDAFLSPLYSTTSLTPPIENI